MDGLSLFISNFITESFVFSPIAVDYPSCCISQFRPPVVKYVLLGGSLDILQIVGMQAAAPDGVLVPKCLCTDRKGHLNRFCCRSQGLARYTRLECPAVLIAYWRFQGLREVSMDS